MIEDGIRLFKRLLVLLPPVGLFLFAADDIYDFFHAHVPMVIALLVTYIAVAYGVIPAFIRLIRFVFPPNHLPYYSTTPDGFASDPLNIGLFGTREEVIKAMTDIGWYQADRRTPRTLWRMMSSTILRRPYLNAPFSRLYLLGRSQDLGFQLPIGDHAGHRHHVRFWAVKPTLARRFKEHVAFWNTHHPDDDPLDNKFLWLGAASQDIGIGVIRHNAQFTHMIHHDTNAERELIVKTLRRHGRIKRSKTITISRPYQLQNRVITGYLQSDGRITICEI
jgi:hypothetical protein